ncbi:MAG: hypothetical protein ACJ79A_20355 [Gemmatimonadaceae bacterium]
MHRMNHRATKAIIMRIHRTSRPASERPRPPRGTRLFLSLALPLAAACTSLEPNSSRAHNLAAASPTELTGLAGANVDPTPTVLVTDDAGAPIKGALISVAVGGGGAVRADMQGRYTAVNGRAYLPWTLGRTPGVNTLSVAIDGATPIVFTAVASPGPVASIYIGGGGQIALPGATLPEPLSARLEDRWGNPVPGKTVTFSVSTGAGTIDAATAVSDASGVARSGPWTLGTGTGMQRVLVQSERVEAIALALSYVCSEPVPGSCATPMELAFSLGSDAQIYRIRTNGTGLTRLTSGGRNYAPAWSPDGRRIAFLHDDDETLSYGDVWLMDADGSNLERRTSGGFYESVDWSPDGTRLAISDYGDEEFFKSVFVLAAVGNGPLTPIATFARNPVWSPDGQRIAFIRGGGDDGMLWVMNADGTGERALTQGGSIQGRLSWSPDGLGVAFTDDGKVYIANADGSGIRAIPSTRDVKDAHMSPDGQWLAVLVYEDPIVGPRNPGATGFMPVAGGTPAVLMPDAYGAAWRP